MDLSGGLGKILSTVIGKGSDLISEFITDKDQAAQLDHAFRIALLEDGQLTQQLEADMFKAQQATIQAELHQSDIYTKRTRPIIARRSFYAGLAYALLTALPEDGLTLIWVTIMAWTFSWEVLMLLYSPALAYMGVRGFEKWKNSSA